MCTEQFTFLGLGRYLGLCGSKMLGLQDSKVYSTSKGRPGRVLRVDKNVF